MSSLPLLSIYLPNIAKLRDLHSLRCLRLFEVFHTKSQDELLDVLKVVGHQLEELTISYMGDFRIKEILECCPVLEKFGVTDNTGKGM